jgi:hypothetical protein
MCTRNIVEEGVEKQLSSSSFFLSAIDHKNPTFVTTIIGSVNWALQPAEFNSPTKMPKDELTRFDPTFRQAAFATDTSHDFQDKPKQKVKPQKMRKWKLNALAETLPPLQVLLL